MQKHKSDLLLATLLWVASLYILLFDDFIEGGLETDLGSLFLPRAAALVVAVLALFIGGPAIKALRAEHGQSDHVADQQGQPQTEENEGSLLWPMLYIVALIAYWFALPILGFVLSTILVVFFVAYIFNCNTALDWLKVLVISLVISFGLDYVTQKFLKVYLPTSTLFS